MPFDFGGLLPSLASLVGTAEGPPESDGRAFALRSGSSPLMCFLLCYDTCVTASGVYYDAGLRCSRTYSSVPEPGPLLVPDGWHESYGFDWVGQPV